jgi:hypothetical protein
MFAMFVGVLGLSLARGSASASSDEASTLAQGRVSAALQQEISQVLWGCYAPGEELVGRGEVERAKQLLRKCYADDMEFEVIMPPALSSLSFVTTDGADGFVETSNAFYRALDLVHVQHLVSNIVIEPTRSGAARVLAGALAIHTYADGGAFNANVTFDIDFRRAQAAWKMAHVRMTVHSVTEAPAWVPTATPTGS